MNDEQIKEYAKQVIRETLEQTDIKLPNFVKKCENKNGEIIFLFNLVIAGEALIWYNPRSAVEEIIKSSVFQHEKGKDSQNKLREAGLPIELIIEFDDLFIRAATSALLKNFAWEFAEILTYQPYLAMHSILFLASINRRAKGDRKEGTASKTSKEADEIIKIFGESRKQRLLAERTRIKKLNQTPEILFGILYEYRLKLWKEAKSCYKRNKKYDSRLAMVKTAFSTLDEDLIARLEDLDPYASMPSIIALVDAARMLKMPEANLSTQTLQDCLAKSRKQLKSKNQDEIKKEFARFCEHITEQTFITERIKQSTKNNAEKINESLH